MKKVFLILITLAVIGCSSKENIPEKLLTKEQMVMLLIDMHISEGKAFAMNVPQDSSKVLSAIFGNEVLRKHNISESVFIENYNYYLLEIEEMNNIYRAVVDSLNYRQKTLQID